VYPFGGGGAFWQSGEECSVCLPCGVFACGVGATAAGGVDGVVVGVVVMLLFAAACSAARFRARRFANLRARSRAACCATAGLGVEVVALWAALLDEVLLEDLLDEPITCPATKPITTISASARAPKASRLLRCTSGESCRVSKRFS
jgi:hypothetical protein